MLDVADQQIVSATSATLSWQPTDADGEPADPGTVTVGVTRSNGDEVIAPATATSGTGTAVRTVALTPAQTAQLDLLTVTWTVSGTVVGVTVVEVIGSPLLSRNDYALREPKASTSKPAFLEARRECDDLFRRECRRGLTPRFAVERITVRDSHTLILRYPNLRLVRWANHIDIEGTRTAFTADEVASIEPNEAGLAVLRDGSMTCGHMVEIGYEHGYSRAPFDVVGAAARYIRYIAGGGTSSVPDRATSFADGQGGVTQLATPGLGPFITGIPEVDEVIVAHRWDGAAGLA